MPEDRRVRKLGQRVGDFLTQFIEDFHRGLRNGFDKLWYG